MKNRDFVNSINLLMETHAHHLHKAPGKNFWHYFFEFLMLFLAVFCGFLAENIREHKIEREREKEYMKSLMSDLKTDVVNLDSTVSYNSTWKQNADSLFYLLTLPDYSGKTNSIYFFSRKVSLRDFFYLTDGTIKQLNNAGGLRLISHQDLVDSISAYENKYSDLEKAQQLKELQLGYYRDACCKVFDVRIYEQMVSGTRTSRPIGNPKLITQNTEDINLLLMRTHYIKRNNASILAILESLKQKANNLQTMIKKVYHIE